MIDATTFARMLAGLGIDLSKQAKAEFDALVAVRAAATTNPATASTDDAAAGLLTAANAAAAVDRLAESYARSQYRDRARRELESVIIGRWNAALRSDTDRLVVALQKVAAEPLAHVQEAGRHFAPDASAKDILDGGLASAKAHAHLTAAIDTLNQVRNLRVELADLAGQTQDVSWWLTGVADTQQLMQAEYVYVRPGNSFHNLAAAGYQIAVNTTAEAAEMVARAHNGTAANEARQTAARAAEMRDSHGLDARNNRTGLGRAAK